MVEQRYRKPQVAGSIPIASSIFLQVKNRKCKARALSSGFFVYFFFTALTMYFAPPVGFLSVMLKYYH